MKRILISMIVVLACGSIALAQNTKEERMKYIRKCYAEAKKKVDANGKNGKSPKDMRLIINKLEDEDVPLYARMLYPLRLRYHRICRTQRYYRCS